MVKIIDRQARLGVSSEGRYPHPLPHLHPKNVVSVQAHRIMLIAVVLAFAKNAMAKRNTMTPRLATPDGWILVSYATEQVNVLDATGQE